MQLGGLGAVFPEVGGGWWMGLQADRRSPLGPQEPLFPCPSGHARGHGSSRSAPCSSPYLTPNRDELRLNLHPSGLSSRPGGR